MAAILSEVENKNRLRGESRSVLRNMVDAENFDALLPQAVHHDIWQRRKQQFTSPVLTPWTAASWRIRQGTDSLVQLPNGGPAVARMSVFEVLADL
jgi:hypothetical protein